MFGNPSLTTRIAVGKGLGALFGIAGFIFLTVFPIEGDSLFRWGILLWYPTLGAVVGMFGVYTRHPVLKLPMPWWLRAPVIGAWLNFVLTFFAYDAIATAMATLFSADEPLASPYWFTLEGAIVGLIIGYFATRLGGEGPETVDR